MNLITQRLGHPIADPLIMIIEERRRSSGRVAIRIHVPRKSGILSVPGRFHHLSRQDSGLDHPSRRGMPEIVEFQVFDLRFFACRSERLFNVFDPIEDQIRRFAQLLPEEQGFLQPGRETDDPAAARLGSRRPDNDDSGVEIDIRPEKLQ